MILSGLCFVVVNFLVKILGAGSEQNIIQNVQSYPAHELVLARSVVSFAISAFIIKRKKIPFLGVNKKWLFIRGLAGTLALTMFFYTLHHMPIAIAAIIQYLAPIFTVLFAMIILKEKVRSIQWVFIGMAFIGVGLIALDQLTNVRLDSEEISILNIGIGILAAVLSGVAYTAVIKLKSTDAPITIVMYFPMISIPLMLALCLWKFTFPHGIEWGILLTIGLFTQFAQILLTKALHNESASTVTPIQYLGAIYMFLIGYFVFEERLSFIVNIGMATILLGVFLNAFFRQRKVN